MSSVKWWKREPTMTSLSLSLSPPASQIVLKSSSNTLQPISTMSGLPGALPSTSSAASPSPSTPTPSAALSPREQALLAAEQRAKQINTPQYSSPDQAHQRSESPFNPTRNDILVFSRIMDSQVRLLPSLSQYPYRADTATV